MVKIDIQTIPHSQQRYNTVGDWYYKDDVVHVRVSELGNWKYEVLVIVHELVEYYLCLFANIKEHEIDKFDMSFEADRPPDNLDECGDSPLAPYREQHFIATTIERILCVALGVKWYEYEDAVNSL